MRYHLSIRNIILALVLLTINSLGGAYGAYAQRPLYKTDTLTIKVFGDIMMHTAQINATQKGFSKYFKYIEEDIRQADIAVANMEFTLAGEPYTGYPTFSAPDEYADFLAKSGFDIFLCANNHIFDKGGKGATRTLDIYRKLRNRYGILYTGLAGSQEELDQTIPLKVIRKGMRVSFVNMTYGTNLGCGDHWPQTIYHNQKHLISNALEKAKKDSDITIILPHWGIEYELLHSAAQTEKATWLIENGADLIIGSHPHVAQDTETINGVEVIYSLGNLVSNMSAANTQLGLMATVRIVRKDNGDIELLPTEITHLWCSRPGGLTDSYSVIPIKDFIGKRNLWLNAWDYDKMIETYDRVRKTHNNER